MDSQEGWTLDAIRQLREMVEDRIPVATMSLKLKRPVEAVRAKLAEIGLTGVES